MIFKDENVRVKNIGCPSTFADQTPCYGQENSACRKSVRELQMKEHQSAENQNIYWKGTQQEKYSIITNCTKCITKCITKDYSGHTADRETRGESPIKDCTGVQTPGVSDYLPNGLLKSTVQFGLQRLKILSDELPHFTVGWTPVIQISLRDNEII